ncbi:MAG TPA: TrbI/VirB10 family protein [Bacteriovoracaceae bacterium]|nr:TrbI/VirB10 family protein [Bacteriovoracaceae bacterium]
MRNFFFKEPHPFTKKKEINWKLIKILGFVFFLILIFVVILIPPEKFEGDEFSQTSPEVPERSFSGTSSTQETINQFESSRHSSSKSGGILSEFYAPNYSPGGTKPQKNKNTSMIIPRMDKDARSQILAGGRLIVKLTEKTVFSSNSVPVIAVVTQDLSSEGTFSIPRGSKLLGEGSLDESSSRAQINFREIIFPDGKIGQISAMAIGIDKELGIPGRIRSSAFRNTVGQTLTRFVGAYAQGSVETGSFGANQGGHLNGLRSAIAATATDRANALGEDLQKQKSWLEVEAGIVFYALLNQSFGMNDEGAVHE